MRPASRLAATQALSAAPPVQADAQKPVEVHHFDLTHQPRPELAHPNIVMGPGTNPAGHTLSATRAYLTLDGQPLALTMGEFHPQRYPRAYWEEAILKMKAGGLNAIAAYFFWNYVEAQPGKFDFSGDNDFRYLVELCKKHDLLLCVRIGPFCNAEVLCGGLPPWIFGMPLVERSNDPMFLKFVGRWYAKLGEQLKGLYWKDGGPIFMVQVENEASLAPVSWKMVYRYGCAEENRGPATKEEFIKYYQNLRDLALKAGIEPVYFSMTGWGALGIPDEFMFGLGGYMYLGQPGKENSALTTIDAVKSPEQASGKPLAFIEFGAAGSPARSDWVPRPPVESALSTAISRLGGSDSIFCGWYMFHGGTTPLYPNWGWGGKSDALSLMSYDFNAPLSEYGFPRPAYYQLRPFHQTLLNFASTFCNGAVVLDQPVVKPDEDRLRVSVRLGDKDGGMIFLLHYGNIKPLSDRAAAIELNTASGLVRVPAHGGLALRNGDFALLPFNLDLGHGVKLVSSTAQLHSRIENGPETLIVCSSIRDQAAEMVFELPAGAQLKTTGTVADENGCKIVRIQPATDAQVTISLTDGQRLLLAPLPVDAVRHSVEAVIEGRKHYLISKADIMVDHDRVRLTSLRPGRWDLLCYPPLPWHEGEVAAKTGLFGKQTVTVTPVEIHGDLEKRLPRKWVLKVPAKQFAGVNDIYTDVQFQGKMCRVFDPATGLPVAEQINDGQNVWQLGLKRFQPALDGQGLVLVVNGDDNKVMHQTAANSMVIEEKQTAAGAAALTDLTFHPEYVRWLNAD